MLRHHYRMIFALTGDLAAGNMGPYVDKGDNDVGLLQDFAYSSAGTPQPRIVWFQGDNFLNGQVLGGAAAHPTFPTSFFGAGLVANDYRSFAGNAGDIVDMTPNAPVMSDGSRYSVLNNCITTNDVMSLSGSFGATMAGKYPDTGIGANPKIASIYAPSSLPGTAHPMVTLLNGFRISNLGTWQTLKSAGPYGVYFYQLRTPSFVSQKKLAILGR